MPDNPNWVKLLNLIPESFHEQIKPVLAEWDQGVQQEFQKRAEQLKKYEGYDQFIDANIPVDWLVEAADLAYQFQENPKLVVENANKVWDLGFVTKEEASQLGRNQNGGGFDSDDDDLDDNMSDITKHPQFAELAKQIQDLGGQVSQFTEQQQQSQQEREWNNFLVKQHEEHGDFNDDYVTALVANGQDFSNALDSYQNLVASLVGGDTGSHNEQAGQGSNSNTGADDKPPVVLGGDGVGSGIPNQPISFGNMKESDLEDTVEQLLANMKNQDAS